jgi:hypothetical protein
VADGASTPVSVRLQILSTEHWSLLASRSLAWNEAFSRAGMFLTVLSGAIVALALVAQATDFGDGFVLSGLLILPVVLFVGVATFVRLGTTNRHEAICVMGMNRIRGAYLEIAPDLAPYFVMSANDDPRGIGITMAMPEGGPRLGQVLAATPGTVAVIDSVLIASIACLVGALLSVPAVGLALLGIATFVIAFAGHVAYGRQRMLKEIRMIQPLFPSPVDDPSAEASSTDPT